MRNLNKTIIAAAFATFATATAMGDNTEFAQALESKTIVATYKPSLFSSAKTAKISVDRSQNLSVSFEQYPELGSCTGKLNVTDDDIYTKNGKILMDAYGLVCSGDARATYRIMLAIDASSEVGVLNFRDGSGEWVISHKKAKLSVE